MNIHAYQRWQSDSDGRKLNVYDYLMYLIEKYRAQDAPDATI